MAALNFPTEESLGRPLESGDTYSAPNNVEYVYDGVKWVAQTNTTTGEYLTSITQDRVAPMFVNGNNTGITFSYDADTNTMTTEVTGGGASLGQLEVQGSTLGTIYDGVYSDITITPSFDGHTEIFIPNGENAYNGASLNISNLDQNSGGIRLVTYGGNITFGAEIGRAHV